MALPESKSMELIKQGGGVVFLPVRLGARQPDGRVGPIVVVLLVVVRPAVYMARDLSERPCEVEHGEPGRRVGIQHSRRELERWDQCVLYSLILLAKRRDGVNLGTWVG